MQPQRGVHALAIPCAWPCRTAIAMELVFLRLAVHYQRMQAALEVVCTVGRMVPAATKCVHHVSMAFRMALKLALTAEVLLASADAETVMHVSVRETVHLENAIRYCTHVVQKRYSRLVQMEFGTATRPILIVVDHSVMPSATSARETLRVVSTAIVLQGYVMVAVHQSRATQSCPTCRSIQLLQTVPKFSSLCLPRSRTTSTP